MRTDRRGFIAGLIALAIAPRAIATAAEPALKANVWGPVGPPLTEEMVLASTTFVCQLPTGVLLLREDMEIDIYDSEPRRWSLRGALRDLRCRVSGWIEEAAA